MTPSTPRDLATRLADLLRRERLAMADFLVALAEFDRGRHWLALGYANLFDFLHRDLGLSKGTAFYRKTAAELIQRYPEIVAPLRDGRLCVTAIHALSKAITPGNRAEVLPRFFHVSKQEAKAVAAEVAPAVVVPRKDVVTVVSVAAAASFPPESSAIETSPKTTNRLGTTTPPARSSSFRPRPLHVRPPSRSPRPRRASTSPSRPRSSRATTAGNMRVLCDFHNQLAARREYGDERMGRYAAPSPSIESRVG